MPKTPFETPCHIHDSGVPGPVVLVVAGTHGDEPAPPFAADRIATWTPLRGRLLVVPRVNPPALAARTRHVPGDPPQDLNRTFPTRAGQEPRSEMAKALWSIVVRERPTLLLDLHEGWGFHVVNPKTVGSTLTFVPIHGGAGVDGERLARLLADVENAGIERQDRKFTLVSPGPAGSFARAVAEVLGIPSLVVETTRVGQPMELRQTQQELAVKEALLHLEMLAR